MAGKKRSRKPEGGGDDGAAADSAAQKKTKKKQRPAAGRQIINESIDCVAAPGGGPGPIRTPLLSSDDRDILIDRLRKEVVEKFGFTLSRKVERNDCDEAQGGASFTMGGVGGIQMTRGGNNDETDETHEKKGTGKKKRKKKQRRPDKSPLATLANIVVKARFVVGVNQCTRALEAAAKLTGAPLPSLVLLSRDVRPPTILAHIPVLCRQLGVPSVVLPGRASVELGRAVGGKSVAVALFLPSRTEDIIGIPDDDEAKKEGDDGGPSSISKGQIQECHRCIDSYVKFALSKIPSASGT